MKRGQIKIDYESLGDPDYGDSNVFLDFNRPMTEENNPNSLDLEPGDTYQVYISYYLGKNVDTDGTRTSKLVVGEHDGIKPIFKEMVLNLIKTPDQTKTDETDFTAEGATRNLITWGSLAIATTSLLA